jgi:hypothetical protein
MRSRRSVGEREDGTMTTLLFVAGRPRAGPNEWKVCQVCECDDKRG